jgi:adenylate kinase
MKRGDLVPDQTVLDIIRERIHCVRCPGGFLLDGFPRTVAQAEAFARIMDQEQIQLDAVLNYDLPIEKVVARLSGRRTCPGCKAVFHVTGRPPRVEGICDHCGTKLQQREDDRPEAVRVRMEVYEKSTKPLTDFYQQRGLLVTIEAEGTPEEIYQRTLTALGSVRSGKAPGQSRTSAN